jgi:hypothetical protein
MQPVNSERVNKLSITAIKATYLDYVVSFVGSTQPPTQWVQQAISPGVQTCAKKFQNEEIIPTKI